MGLKQLLSKWIEVMVFVFCMKMVVGANDVIRMTRLCILNLSCKLPCKLEPYSEVNVLWFNGHNEILTQGRQIIKHNRNLRIEKPALNEWILHILRVNRNSAGSYWCKTNDGRTLSEITLVIEHEPKIDESSSSLNRVYFQEHSLAQLICNFSGTPEPEITWHRGQAEEHIVGIKGNSLIVRNVERYASDDYTCIAKNKHGTAKRHMKLIVNFSPEVTVMEPEISVAKYAMVTMGCVVQASPLFDAFWTNHEGFRIKGETWRYLLKEEKENDTFPVRFLELQIKKNEIRKQAEGRYTCHGHGVDTESQDVVVLKVKDPD